MSKISFANENREVTANPLAAQHHYFSIMHEAVRVAARLHLFPAACLQRSIVLADMLRARGYSAEVFLGVAKSGMRLSSHAWVEVDGHMVAEPESVVEDFTKVTNGK